MPYLENCIRGGREVKIYDGEHYRNLTPKEYFRLMGFTDEDVELLELNGISKTQLYKMAGNSIPVKMLEHLFSALYPKKRVAALISNSLKILEKGGKADD